VIGDFPGLDLTGVKLKKYIESSAISPNGKRIAVGKRRYFTIPAEKGDAIFLIVRASRIELWLGLRMVRQLVF
jgi:hypothetical protein